MDEERPSDPKDLKVWLLEQHLKKLQEEFRELKGLVSRLQEEVSDKRPPHR